MIKDKSAERVNKKDQPIVRSIFAYEMFPMVVLDIYYVAFLVCWQINFQCMGNQ